jgi:uncharacterized OsmC-like protein
VNTQDTLKTVNGVDAGALEAMIENIKEKPSLAQARFRARNTWISGGHNRTSIQGFYAAGGEDESREQPFIIDSDEPPVLLGENRGANAVEIALTALASCMTGTLVYYGAAMGIELEEVSAELEGDLDQRGLFGIEETARNGFQHIRVDYRIKSPEPRERILELLGVARDSSPLYDMMTNPVPVSLRLVD